MDPQHLLTIINIVYLLITIHLWTELKAMQKSTHQVQYVDPFQEFSKDADPKEEKISEESDLFENVE